MELSDAVVVVTGGGSGIGAALVERIAVERPAAIVVVDLDDAAAEAVRHRVAATHPGIDLWHAAVDVADEAQVRQLVHDVQARNGTIDLFCANAGIGSAMGIDAPDEVWERVMGVNLMAHVYAARALVPGWCERGRGHLLVTASAAGLLSNLGDAPYSVSKHGAVALAEWLSITYGDRGVGVSCLCPQGVRTPLLFGSAGGMGDGALATEVVKAQRILEPEDVADVTVAALAEDRFLILPHEEVADFERARAGDRERWLGAMRRLQARLDAV
jgi:NAD(P)-dependent dehydrogenase (short-subunit alcohol dehydrogenase family)